MSTITRTFGTPSNWTYDSDLIDLSSGNALLKDIRPADSTCAAFYKDNINLSWGDGVLTGTGTGSPVITSEELDLTAASNQYVDYDAIDNADSQQVGCMRVPIRPNWSGNPANGQYLFLTSKGHNDGKNLISIYQLTTGNVYLWMVNSAGASIIQANLGV